MVFLKSVNLSTERSTPDTSPIPQDRDQIEIRLREFFAERAAERGLVTAYLFGSVARGTAHPGSDVDVGVLFAKAPPRTLEGLHLDLEGELEQILDGLPVQLVVLNRASPELVHFVLVDGRLLLDRDPAKRIEFEVRSRNEYFDILPILRRYRGQEATR